MPSMERVLERIRLLTEIDLQRKSIFQLFASASSELGEVADALNIEEGTYGNTHKTLDEDSQHESADLAICALALFYARGGTDKTLVEIMNKKLDKWEATK